MGGRGRVAAAAVAGLLRSACAVEKVPPPESVPPLVPEAAAAAPQQPTEPQSWSRGLDFDSVPPAMDRDSLARGLVPAEDQARYSEQRLTYESAFDPQKPPSAAELARKRAQERAAADRKSTRLNSSH